MPRTKKDAKILNVKLATPVYDRLEEFCEESGMSKTVAAEKIFTQFFDCISIDLSPKGLYSVSI